MPHRCRNSLLHTAGRRICLLLLGLHGGNVPIVLQPLHPHLQPKSIKNTTPRKRKPLTKGSTLASKICKLRQITLSIQTSSQFPNSLAERVVMQSWVLLYCVLPPVHSPCIALHNDRMVPACALPSLTLLPVAVPLACVKSARLGIQAS